MVVSSSSDSHGVVIRKQVQSVQFGFYTDDDVRHRSLVEITCPTAFDPLTGTTPMPGGLYDARMGPMMQTYDSKSMPCPTCARLYHDCPGHAGHIELVVPVHHPLLRPELLTILRNQCRYCLRFRAVPRLAQIQVAKMKLLSLNRLTEYAQMDTKITTLLVQARAEVAAKEAANNTNNTGNTAAAVMSRASVGAVDDYLNSILSDDTTDSSNTSTVITAGSCSSYHSTLYVALKKETLALLKGSIRCAHCGAYSPKVRHDAHNKFFRSPLVKKYQRLNDAEGLQMPSTRSMIASLNQKNNIANHSTVDGYDSDDTVQRTQARVKRDGAENSDDDNGDNDSDDPMDGDNDTENDDEELAPRLQKARDVYIHTSEVQALVRHLWNLEPTLAAGLFGNVNQYVLQCIAVPPSRFRPPMNVSGGGGGAIGLVEHVQTAALSKILAANTAVRDKMASRDTAAVYPAWIALQTAVNIYMDAAQDPAVGSGAQTQVAGIRQMLERKEGLFRKHMMGKRVDFACRSVVSPDPYIGTNEIGLPLHFCRVLTYPTPVTERNAAELRRLVERGPNDYPGARWVELASTSSVSVSEPSARRRIDLSKMKPHQRKAIAAQLMLQHARSGATHGSPVIVGRQLRDGDYVLMNRQPTLHKPGIMAHRVRVLHNPDQKTIRMHYANCNTYNADFDGDEMNCHFPQNDLARAEAQYIAQTDLQYIVPTDGSPLRGLIQDHVVGGVKMTQKDTFFKRWEFQQLLFAALASLPGLEVIRHDAIIEMVPPAIIKPCELWSGKQVLSAILLHLRKGSDRDGAKLSNFPGLSMERQTKTPDTAFGAAQNEHLVLIRDGELLRGVLDKNAFGATDFSLVHCVYEAYGPEKAGLLLNVLGRLFTAYIQFYAGHSCRMEDLILTKKADLERKKLIQRAYNIGARAAKAWADSEGGKIVIPTIKDQVGADLPLKPVEAASAATKIGILLSGNSGPENFAALDGFMQGQLNPLASDIVKKSLPSGLAVPFPHNTFGIMTTTGAKGSIVNQSQVTCALGQQALEGRRVPRLSSGRTLPSFAPYDPSPRADGFVMDRFLTGIRPQEYYFHCMAGREGLVDTAVKTSRSGYLQRCLVKHLEELKICYDYTVRNSEGNVVQFMYGEDGLDPTKAAFLDCSARSLEYIARNHKSLLRHNVSLPSSTIETAAFDAQRNEELKSPSLRPIKKGDSVMARRLRSGRNWVRGAICQGWSCATVLNVSKDRKTVDLKYLSDSHKVAGVPIEADLGRTSRGQTNTLSNMATIVKPCVLDPIISTPARGHRFGTSGACVSEKVASASERAMRDTSKLGKVLKDINLQSREMSSIIGAKYSSSVCSPGEAVGSIAAQSVGEPSTQMTLNTFHLAGAGANVTLGIPRLREIIMTASRALKTPTMSVPLLDSVTVKQATRLARGFTKLSLMDLVAGKRGISVTERLQQDGGSWQRAYYVNIKLHPAERVKEAFGLSLHDVAKVVAKNFVPLLAQIMKKELKRSSVEGDGVGEVTGGTSSEYFDVGEKDNGPAPSTPGDDFNEVDDDDDDDDDAPGEEDGVAFDKRKDDDAYDDDGVDDDASEEDVVEAEPTPLMMDQTDLELNERDSPVVNQRSNSISLQALMVEPNVRPLLMVGLIEKAASATLVRSRKNINEAFINDEVKRGRCLQTSGINFEEIWKLSMVNHDELMSNDIWAVRCSYGVEAARSSILSQIRSVFGAYGIEVDARHLSLIADYMTYDGGFKPMSRIGMEDCSSVLLQMSFETTAQFLNKAALTNAHDFLASPSANIVLGRPIQHGTGSFALLVKS